MKSKSRKLPRSRKSAKTHRPAPAPSIVGIGASAGGLEAFTLLLKQLPVDTGFGFVLVQHLDPQHESALTQLLARATTMPVREVTNNLRVLANHVYIIPPNTSLGITSGVLKLQPRSKDRVAPRSIDFFFESLAKDQCERSIGVILSGAATDGTLGLEAIKAEGGLTFAQDDSARYDSMPRSAVAAGCVDFVLSPGNIARELARIATHPYVAERVTGSGMSNGEKPLPSRGKVTAKQAVRKNSLSAHETDGTAKVTEEEDGYKKVLRLLRNHCGVDFSLYKSTTIQRRIMRRTVLSRRNKLEDYAAFLQGNAKELDALYSDALIGVTSFFRNADAFDLLQKKIFPKLLQQGSDEPVRVWVLGCSTGQEAYSLAIAFSEAAEKMIRPRKIQVFATDLNEANLHKARHGLYAKTLAQDVSPERLKRFFIEEDGGYRVIKTLRESVVFARQNVISDPPFSRMDLISCRNLMIYLEPSLQKKVLPTFHYALKPDGFLFLGASESIGGFNNLFQAVDKKQKIFAKRAAPTVAFQLPVHKGSVERSRASYLSFTAQAPNRKPGGGGMLDAFRSELNAEREADRVTVNQFAPPGVLINADLQILQFRGATGAYLEPPTGKASFDLLKMAREGLMLSLRTAILLAKKEDKTTRKENVPLTQDGRTRLINLEVVPLKNLKERCFLVLFEDTEKAGRDSSGTFLTFEDPVNTERASGATGRKDQATHIIGLERDLAETRDYLQSIQENHESANEELQASNEEGQSANEELQSLNEELETSKEELESTNEELTTVNEEMVSRNSELNRLNADLTNLQTSTNFVVVLLGRDLTVRRFSVQAEKQFRLHASDLGRPIGGIRHNLKLADLSAIIAKVIASGHETEREVQDRDGHWYSLRLRPYITVDGAVDGAVLVLVDIDELKKTERLITEAHEHAEAIIRTVPNPLVTLTSNLRVQSTNDAFNRTFKVSPKDVKDRSIFEIDNGAWNTPRLRHLLKEVIPRDRSFNEFELTHNFERIGRRSLLLNARVLNEPASRSKEILLGIQDVTEILAFQSDLRRSEMRFRRLFETAKDGILILDPATRKITDANPFIVKLLGYTREQLIKKELWQIGLLKDEAASQKAFQTLKAQGFIRYEDLPLKSKGGQRHEVEFVSNLYDEDGEEVIQCNIRDITERKQSENALIASEERFRILFNLGPVAVYSCDNTGVIREFNLCAAKLWGRKPQLGSKRDRFCGSAKMYLPDGSYLPHAQCPMAAVLNGRTPGVRDTEVIIERPDGSRITVIANIVPLKNTHGKITGAINCFYDITARKRTEDSLKEAQKQLVQHAGRLQQLVAERTAKLTASNKLLEDSVDFVKKGREEYHNLLLESQDMQKKLRHLTRQIITAQEEERKAISRELHDEVVQSLVGINVELSALGKDATVKPELLEKIAHTQRLVENAVHSVHRFARELRPSVLDDLGLIPALHAYSKNLADRKKIKIQLTAFGGIEALGAAERTTLFRVAQEALTNVTRHAQASTARISITQIPGAVRMEVSDDGKSFQVGKTLLAKNNKRLGLVGMRERVEMVGGNLTIESTPGKGTTVRTEIPFIPKKRKP
jgi:two-component system, chemotaxis family, CheB/CheR fusion protein